MNTLNTCYNVLSFYSELRGVMLNKDDSYSPIRSNAIRALEKIRGEG